MPIQASSWTMPPKAKLDSSISAPACYMLSLLGPQSKFWSFFLCAICPEMLDVQCQQCIVYTKVCPNDSPPINYMRYAAPKSRTWNGSLNRAFILRLCVNQSRITHLFKTSTRSCALTRQSIFQWSFKNTISSSSSHKVYLDVYTICYG